MLLIIITQNNVITKAHMTNKNRKFSGFPFFNVYTSKLFLIKNTIIKATTRKSAICGSPLLKK
jgi:hypothetical protein